MRLIDLFENLYRPLRLRGRSPNTARLYGCTIRSFGKWLGREPVLTDLEELSLARFLEHRAATRSPFTAEKERSQLMALASLAWERRMIEMKPSCPPAPLPERIPTAWSVDGMQRLMSAAEDPSTYGRSNSEHYARIFPALIAVAWDTGERIGAIVEARREDYVRPNLLIRAEARKGRKRDRLYQLSAATCERIERAMYPGCDRLFLWTMSKTYLWDKFGAVVKAAGLETGSKRLRFHQVRRTALSHFAAAGGDPVAMADHSSPKITKRWYLDPRLTEVGPKPCDVLPSIAPAAGADEPTVISIAG